ncbi:MAG: DNA methyltransferase [Rhizomicrobium sp.]
MSEHRVEQMAVSVFHPRQTNPRTHSKKQIRQIADSIREFGFISHVLIDANSGVIAGHGRVEAAKLLGMKEVPAIRIDHLTETQIRAYVIADNKLAMNAGWDEGLLRIELQELSVNLGFDVTLTGFEIAEIDNLIIGGEVDEDDEFEQPDLSKPAVSRPGDMWRIGPHAVLCADATKSDSYDQLLGGLLAQMSFADPPYNVPIQGHVSGLGKIQHAEFAMASGEMSPAEFTAFLQTIFRNLAGHSVEDSIHYICMDWRHMREVLDAAEDTYAQQKNLCVWAKTNGGMGSFYRSQHELVFVFQNGRGSHVNNIELGKHGRYRTNLWSYAGVNTFGANRDAELAMHPTVKPVALVADAIRDASRRNAVILDAFGGSGTTLVAAERTGRRGFALEISPAYVDTIVKRVSEAAGVKAVLDRTSQTFEAVREWRMSGLDGDIFA